MAKILVVDDEISLIEMIQMRLEANGYDVITAHDGQEGLDKAKSEKPDLIILDVMMPKMDGYKVCGLLKNDARFNNIPIILFTARAQKNDIDVGEEVGADAYCTKPFDPKFLLGQIEALLKKAAGG